MLNLNKVIIHIFLQVNPDWGQVLLHLLLIISIVKFYLAATTGATDIATDLIPSLLIIGHSSINALGFILGLEMLLEFPTLAKRILEDVTLGFETFLLHIYATVHHLLLFKVKHLGQIPACTH